MILRAESIELASKLQLFWDFLNFEKLKIWTESKNTDLFTFLYSNMFVFFEPLTYAYDIEYENPKKNFHWFAFFYICFMRTFSILKQYKEYSQVQFKGK